jgi:integrase
MQAGSLKRVKHRGVNVWRAQWREDGSGRTRILGRCSDLSRADARAELDRIVSTVNGQLQIKRKKPSTLRQFVENEYFPHKESCGDWKESTASTTTNLIEVHILSELGHRHLTSLGRRELQEFLQRKADAGLSFSVVAHLRYQLGAILKMAKGDGLMEGEPAGSLGVPATKKATDKRVITIAQITRAQMTLDLRERLAFRLAVCEGMRPGEIVALQIGDLRDNLLHIERRVYRGKIDTPKSHKSRRKIPPTPATAELLERYLAILGASKPDAWVFPSETGTTPISYSNLYRRRIQPALTSVGLGTVNFQILRRTWVTEFSQVEDDPHVRAQLAGHNVDVHQNEYRQGKIEVLRNSMEKFGKHVQ